ncbi:hypothetical protein JCM5296_005685 [Sporobolomyces johnsonii]
MPRIRSFLVSSALLALVLLFFALLPAASASAAVHAPLFPLRHSHLSSRALLSPSPRQLLKARQAVAATPSAYTSLLHERRVRETVLYLRTLGVEVEAVRDEVGRQVGRARKLRRRDERDRVGQAIHNQLFHLLQVLSSDSHTSRSFPLSSPLNKEDLALHVAAVAPSASPQPSARAKRSSQSTLTPDDAARALSRTATSIRHTLAAVSDAVARLPDHREALEALLDDVQDELDSLIEGTHRRLPELEGHLVQTLVSTQADLVALTTSNASASSSRAA